MRASWCWLAVETTLSEAHTLQDPPPVWSPDPLLSARRTQVPQFLRTQWDEATARGFGPWRVAAPVDPAAGQTLTAFAPQPTPEGEAQAPTGEAQAADANSPDSGAPLALPHEAEAPATAWSDAAIAAVRQEAWQQGMEEGLRQAREEHEAERHKEGEILRHLGIELRSLQQDPQRFFEPLKRLALHIAEQWVRGELQVSGQAIDQLVRQCLAQLDPTGEPAHVDLNPADLERLQALGEHACADLLLHGDPQLREGSVRVRLNESVVQDLIEHRIEAMARQLLQQPEAWMQHSALLHPDKAVPVQAAPASRNWSRQSAEVQDADVRDLPPDDEVSA